MEEIELSKLNQSPILGVIDLDKPRAENKFYTLAIVTENRLKKMNLILTFLGVLLMIIEVL